MTRAGFTAVFIGIESPSAEALAETHKLQNLRRDLVTQVHELLDRGLDVYAGFILGFDHDGEDCFDRMIDFVGDAAIPYAMVGMMTALPNTPLYKRLEREGRLRFEATGDTHHLTNVVTRMPTEQMVAGYLRVLETLYHPETYFRRCRENLTRWKPVAGSRRPMAWHDLRSAARALWTQGVAGRYRGAYWRFLAWVLRHHPAKIGRAMAQAGAGHHYITYTRNVVVPALTESLPLALEEQSALAS